MSTGTPSAAPCTLPPAPAWHAAFPSPTANLADGSLAALSCSELKRMQDTEGNDLMQRSFLVVDVRRTDFENTCIAGAINFPAQSFYTTLPSLLPLLSRYRTVIFHCSSSKGRGPRCAGWYQDAVHAAGLQNTSSGAVLTGGVVAWQEMYGKDEKAVVAI
ncbi:hypothetical protein JCM8097_001713 [Rhodosporidiobolus ruineniae]